MRLSLDDHEDRNYWAAFGDIALATLLVFILGALSQFDKVITWQEIERRQKEVQQLIEDRLPHDFRRSVTVRNIDSQNQRVTFSSDALFPTCKVDLTARGDSIVRFVGGILSERVRYFERIQIEGHTDSLPPVGPPSCPVEDNWELSSQRATNVVRLLTINAILPPKKLSSMGRGEYHPVSDSLPLNRRIELVLKYAEPSVLSSEDGP